MNWMLLFWAGVLIACITFWAFVIMSVLNLAWWTVVL